MASGVSAWVNNSNGHRSSTFTWPAGDHAAQYTPDYPDVLRDSFTVVFNPSGVNYDVTATLAWNLDASYDGGTTWVNVISESGKAIDDVAYRYYYDRLIEGALPAFRIKADTSGQLDAGAEASLEVIVIPN